MPVYEGILEQFSAGSEVAPHGTGERINQWGRVSRQGVDRRIRRQFVEIGGQHIKNVVLTPYHDELLTDSLGDEVALSVFGWGQKQVVAIRTPRGVDRPHFVAMVLATIWATFLSWLLALILGGLLFGMAALTSLGVLNVLATVVVVFLLIWPFVQSVRVFRAWGALSSRPPTHPSPLTSITADTTTILPSAQALPAGSAAPESASSPPPRRFCGDCGAERSPGGRFCTSCGHA